MYIIPTGDEFGVNNTLIFTDGNPTDPEIERVVHIFLDNETDIEKVRDIIYGKEVNQWTPKSDIASNIYGTENFAEYTKDNIRNVHSTIGGSEGSTRPENSGDNSQQRNRTGDSGKSAEYEVGYKGESRYRYYNEDIGGYFVELVDGTKLRFYLPAKGSKDKRYSTGRAKYKTIKAMIKAENTKILRKSNNQG